MFCPLLLINTALYVFLHNSNQSQDLNDKYQVHLRQGKSISNQQYQRGASVIGFAEAEDGKRGLQLITFQFAFLCGLIHDYKHFEITEMAYPLFEKGVRISGHFDEIFDRVNPIAPQYMQDEESVNEAARVLMRIY